MRVRICLACMVLMTAAAARAAIPLVVIPDKPTAVEKFAAAELADELGKCLGYRPVVICERASRKGPMLYVGATKAAKAAREELNFQRPYKTDEVFLKSVPYGVVLDGELSRERRFRLRDNYTRFYLKFIEPYKEVIDEGAFLFSSLSELEGIDAVLGLAFENLVVNNYRMLLPYMHLTNTLITAAGPYRRRAAKSARGKPGVQVDLMLQTRRSLWFVEVKRKREIDREIETEVERKVKALSRPEGVSSKMALVYDGHLSPLVESDGYFDAIVPFKNLLGLN